MTNKVMIIDDNETNVKLLNLVLTKAGFKTDTIINPKFAFDIIKETKPWESKLGGCPYLSSLKDYPKDDRGMPMMFLAQINFE